ncbi:hypothetical protein SY83_14395 [Paenibacillus swuensis]|uniref:DUF58 domain-containing protein n=1 Tax=Paenibacillus swuensis TaxID=1178515 RepID=A0A172TJN4_9BACL|nr:DUF58 domain-containing protein [Paenibacillus swuensis]ANE47261.1 hypothetical protein SY83_14395 [Paenibacillus swuensis]
MSARYSAKFWAAGICLLSSLLFVLLQGGKVSSMLFIVLCVLMAYIALGRFSGIQSVQGKRTVTGAGHEPVAAGTQVEIKLQVHVPGYWPIPYVLLKDKLLRQNGDEWIFENAAAMDWKRNGEIAYRTPPLLRGRYSYMNTECVVKDVFGLFSHEGLLPSEQQFSVLPQTVHIKEWRSLDRAVRGHLQHSAATRAVRETTQINGVREYIYGDKLSRIHWNATAKTGTWKSKEFEREARPRTVLVLDRSHSSYTGTDTFELAVSVAASIVDYSAQKDLSVGLISAGKSATIVEPKQSKGIHRSLNDHLIGVEADGVQLLSTVLKERLTQEFRGSFVVIISPVQSQHMLDTLSWLEQRQMIPCHIHVGEEMFSKEAWHNMLRRSGFSSYSIRTLGDLPGALGGGGI